jgi:hypothetical protein
MSFWDSVQAGIAQANQGQNSAPQGANESHAAFDARTAAYNNAKH